MKFLITLATSTLLASSAYASTTLFGPAFVKVARFDPGICTTVSSLSVQLMMNRKLGMSHNAALAVLPTDLSPGSTMLRNLVNEVYSEPEGTSDDSTAITEFAAKEYEACSAALK
jgi:hypothetical protein